MWAGFQWAGLVPLVEIVEVVVEGDDASCLGGDVAFEGHHGLVVLEVKVQVRVGLGDGGEGAGGRRAVGRGEPVVWLFSEEAYLYGTMSLVGHFGLVVL